MLKKRTTLNPHGASEQDLIDELIHCNNDPVYFIQTYCKVEHPTNGPAPLRLDTYQAAAIADYQLHKTTIQLVARRCNKTNVLLAYALWHTIFKPCQTVLYTSPSAIVSFDSRNRLTFMHDHLPSWLKLKITAYNRHEVVFENLSRIKFDRVTESCGKGLTVSLLICDDFAHSDSKNQYQFYVSTVPAIQPGGRLIIASSYGREYNFFAELWDKAMSDNSTLHPIKWTGKALDEKTSYNLQCILSPEQWRREYLCEPVFEAPSHDVVRVRRHVSGSYSGNDYGCF